MIDKYGRNIDYLRISLTDRCNLRCAYCMPEDGITQLPHEQILTFDEILRVCAGASQLGIRKVKLTGGEPLVRRDCAALAGRIKKLPGIEKVTLTTNGVLLAEQMDALAEAGIDAINISLDTLDRELFRQITRRDELDRVIAGLKAAMAHPEICTKLNCVPTLERRDNLVAMAGLAKKYPLHVRFIEMMPIGYGRQFAFQGEDAIKEALEAVYGPMTLREERYGNGPCHYYSLEGFQGRIGFISAVTHKFCHECNRVRLTAEGFLKGCLQFQEGISLRDLMRGGCTDAELTEAMRETIYNKPVSHNFYEAQTEQDEMRVMAQIGG